MSLIGPLSFGSLEAALGVCGFAIPTALDSIWGGSDASVRSEGEPE